MASRYYVCNSGDRRNKTDRNYHIKFSCSFLKATSDTSTLSMTDDTAVSTASISPPFHIVDS